jgi:hypothetical protein
VHCNRSGIRHRHATRARRQRLLSCLEPLARGYLVGAPIRCDGDIPLEDGLLPPDRGELLAELEARVMVLEDAVAFRDARLEVMERRLGEERPRRPYPLVDRLRILWSGRGRAETRRV